MGTPNRSAALLSNASKAFAKLEGVVFLARRAHDTMDGWMVVECVTVFLHIYYRSWQWSWGGLGCVAYSWQ